MPEREHHTGPRRTCSRHGGRDLENTEAAAVGSSGVTVARTMKEEGAQKEGWMPAASGAEEAPSHQARGHQALCRREKLGSPAGQEHGVSRSQSMGRTMVSTPLTSLLHLLTH